MQVPGASKVQYWDSERYERNKDKLYEQFPDTQVVEMRDADLGNIEEKESYVIDVPGAGGLRLWDGAKLARNREKLLEQFPEAKITTARHTDYYGDKLRDIYGRMDILEQELRGLPAETSVPVANSSAGAVLMPEPGLTEEQKTQRRRRREINEELTELKRQREDNPVWKSYLQREAHDAEANIRRLEQVSADLRAKHGKEMAGRPINVFSTASSAGTPVSYDSDPAYTAAQEALEAARLYYKDISKTVKAPSKYGGDAKGAMSDFWQGAVDGLPKALSVANMIRSGLNIHLIDAVKAIQDHEADGEKTNIINLVENDGIDKADYLNTGQKELVKAFVKKAETDGTFSDRISKSYQAGQGAVQSLGFMADFVLAGGVGGGVANAVTGGVTKAAKAGTNTLAKVGAEALYGTVKALAMTPVMPSSAANFADGMLQLNDAGSVDVSGKAIARAAGDVIIENISETVGSAPLKIAGIPLQKVRFPDWVKALGNSTVAQSLKQAGYNGFFEEMVEEWTGNALRVMTGVDRDALKNFATVEQQLITAGSFAPMSLVGIPGSAVRFSVAKKSYADAGAHLEKIIDATDEKKRQAIRDAVAATGEAETPEDLGGKMADIYRQLVDGGADERKAFTAALRYTQEAAQYKLQAGAMEEARDVERAAKQLAINVSVGGENWYHKGRMGENRVRVITDEKGEQFFVVAEENNTLALVDMSGGRRMASADMVSASVEAGLMKDRDALLSEYLDGLSFAEKQAAEQERMHTERQEADRQVTQLSEPGMLIPMGTAEDRVDGTVVEWSGGKCIVQMPDGTTQELSADEVANRLGVDIHPRTDAEIDEETQNYHKHLSDLKSAANGSVGGKFKMDGLECTLCGVTYNTEPTEGDKPVVIYYKDAQGNSLSASASVDQLEQIVEEVSAGAAQNATEEEEESAEAQNSGEEAPAQQDTTPRDFRGNPLPLRQNAVTGEYVVDEDVLWNNDPEAWVRYNDANPSAVITSAEKVESAMDGLDRKIADIKAALRKAALEGGRQDAADKLGGELQRLSQRRAVLEYIRVRQQEKAMIDEYDDLPPDESGNEYVPVKTSGEKEYMKATQRATYEDIYSDESFADAGESYGFISGRVKNAKRSVEHAQKALDRVLKDNRNGRYASAADFAAAKKEASDALATAMAEQEYWAGVMDIADNEEAAAKKSASDAAARREDERRTPKSLHELVADAFIGYQHRLNRESFRKETGYGDSDMRKFFQLWARKGQGASVYAMAEEIAANDELGLVPVDDNGLKDTRAVVDAILDVFASAQSPSDLYNYTRNANLAREEEERRYQDELAERYAEEERQEAEAGETGKTGANPQGHFQYFNGTLHELISAAKSKVKGLFKMVLAPVSTRLESELKAKGVEINNEYRHTIDNNAITHTLNQHGSESEEKRGQIPVTEADFERIPEVVENYDDIKVETGKRGLENIVYSKIYPDGTTIYVEEVRSGKKELAAVTMWKKKNPALTGANREDTTPIPDLSRASASKDTKTPEESNTYGRQDEIEDLPSDGLAERSAEEERSKEKSNQEEETYKLSDKVDENGRQFVLNSEGNISFGEITQETGLKSAPILLSEGLITNPATNDGYGLVHIEARHGDQIREAGFKSVVDFIEAVARNYETIREGNIRDGIQTYLIQLRDKHNNTLMVELSGDGTYWNVNTAGIFKTSYGAKRKEVYSRHTTAGQTAESVEESQDKEQRSTTSSSSMNSSILSASKDTKTPEESNTYGRLEAEGNRPDNNGVVGRSLSEDETIALIDGMRAHAEAAQEMELTPENWTAQFGENGEVETPLGKVTMGENQYFKLAQQGRKGKLGMVKPTLQTPFIVVEDFREDKSEKGERFYALVFIKTFRKENGDRYYHFTSVTVSKDGREVVISNQEESANRISKLLQQGKVAWISSEFSLHPKAQVEESVPLDDSNKPTMPDNQSALLGISSSELPWDNLSASKDTKTPEESNTYGRQDEIEDLPSDEDLAVMEENRRQEPLKERVRQWEERLGVKITVHTSLDDVKNKQAREEITEADAAVANGAAREKNRVNGWYNTVTGEVELYLPHILSEEEIDARVMHEVVAHRGLRELLGTEGFNGLMEAVWSEVMSESDRARYLKYALAEGVTDEVRRAAADEYVAHLAETISAEGGQESGSAWSRFVAKVRELLKSLGFEMKITDTDLRGLLRDSIARFEVQRREGGAPQKTAEAENTPHSAPAPRGVDAESAESITDEIKPIGKGAFGDIYDAFKGKVKEAFDFLLKHKEGDLLGVFHREDIGDIDLVWGNEDMGLAHILDKHVGNGKDFATQEEMFSAIEKNINKGDFIQDNKNRYVLSLDGYRVGIRKDFNGEKKNWVVTAVDYNRSKKEKGIATNPTSASLDVNGPEFAAPNNTSSTGKGSNSSEESNTPFANDIFADTLSNAPEELKGRITVRESSTGDEQEENFVQSYDIDGKPSGISRIELFDAKPSENPTRFVIDGSDVDAETAEQDKWESLAVEYHKTHPDVKLYVGDESGIGFATFKDAYEFHNWANEHQSGAADRQGNPLNADGTLKVDVISSIDKLTDEDFTNPTRNVQLPELPKNVDSAIGADGKPVVIKKSIFERNKDRHADLTAQQSREILSAALYDAKLYGQTQEKSRPYNWVVIALRDEGGNNRLVLLEVNDNKDNVEIVHWHFVDEKGLEKLKKQAKREDGQLLILPSAKEEAGALSSPTQGSYSNENQAERNGGELIMLSKGKVESLSTPAQSLSSDGKGTNNSERNNAASEDKKESAKKDDKDRIEDVGEKIGGAKKDKFKEGMKRVQEDSARSDTDLISFIASTPISKIFGFDLAKFREGGVSNEAVSFVQTVKKFLPAKPRTQWKLRRWTSNILSLYRTSLEALSNWDSVNGLLNSEAFASTALKRRYDAYMAVGGFDGGLNIGDAELTRLTFGAGTYDKNGKWISHDGYWGVTKAGEYSNHYPTKEEAVAALKAFAGENAVSSEEDTEIKFVVYRRTADNSLYITPKGKSELVIADGFKSAEEAFKYLKEYNAELQERYRTLMDGTKTELGENRERKGRDYRAGKDIGADEFRETFGFRGVEFGNWMTQADRAKALNECYDALMDLADVCGVSPKALSLDGKLAMAFGARGGGRFNAHYEPGKVVINMTKTRGAGSLAHEWFHAVDNYFARMGGANADGFATSKQGINPGIQKYRFKSGEEMYYDGKAKKYVTKEEYDAAVAAHSVRKEMAEAWAHLIDAIAKSDYGKRSRSYASLHHSNYWNKPTEMGARAFSVWVENQLSRRNAVNDYLANNPKLLEEALNDDIKRYSPYPFNTDADWMDEAFGNLFSAMEQRTEEETGNVALFQVLNGALGIKNPAQRLAYDAVSQMLSDAGIPVEEVSDEAMRQMAEGAEIKGEALETVSSQNGYQQTVISSASGAKVLKNLDSLHDSLENAEKTEEKTFLGRLAEALGAKRHGSNSQYATFEAKNGVIVTIRLANHNAATSTFDSHNEDNGISIVISARKNRGINNDGAAHVTEYYYDAIKLRKAEGKPLAEIVKSIKQMLHSGEYKDTTGLAQVEEVNAENIPELMTRSNSPRVRWMNNYVEAVNLVTGESKKEIKRKITAMIAAAREEAKKLYANVLSGNFNDVTLRQINDYIDNATNRNRFYRPLSQRLPERALLSLSGGGRAGEVDALFSRICESSVPANGRTRAEARRRIEAKKEELLEGWAKATGNWHESVADFTSNTEPIGHGTDSDVYMSDDGATVIKASKGKFGNRKFPTDIDQVPLFNVVFPRSAYRILGYGRVDGKFVKYLEQPYIDFGTATPLMVEERVQYMHKLGFEPRNEEKTVFSNGEIIVSDLQKSNIVREAAGNVRGIDADVKLHTRDIGGNYTYPPVEADTDIHDDPQFMTVYHGSGAKFDKFDSAFMGTGEGAQAYGWGHYVTEVESIGKIYADASTMINGGSSLFERVIAYIKKRMRAGSSFEDARNTIVGKLESLFGRNAEKAEYASTGETIERLKNLSESDIPQSALYTIDIPEDTGENYLSYDGRLSEDVVSPIADKLSKIGWKREDDGHLIRLKKGGNVITLNSMATGADLYAELQEAFGSDKAASEFLGSIGYAGIKYPTNFRSGGNAEGTSNYVIFKDSDLKIVDRVAFLRDGAVVYGAAVGGKIYLNAERLNPNTPIHEYTHLWDKACAKSNPELWNRGVELMKQTSLWKEVENDPNYAGLDEEGIASEVHARLTGEHGAELLERLSKEALEGEGGILGGLPAVNVIHRLRGWLSDFWQWVKDTMAPWSRSEAAKVSIEDFVNMPIADLAKGTRLSENQHTAEEQLIIDNAMKDGTYMKAPNGKLSNLSERQWVQVRTKSFKKWFGDWEKATRIEKLRKSEAAKISGDEIPITEDYKQNQKNALKAGKSIRATYVNADTGKEINLMSGKHGGLKEILNHDYKDVEHIQSIAAIPQIIEKGIYIDTVQNEEKGNNPSIDAYEYYVCGLKIGGIDYLVKAVIGIDDKGNRYYDHKLTRIEKGKLLAELANQPIAAQSGLSSEGTQGDAVGSISADGNAESNKSPLSGVKDKRLLSILQNNSSKVVDENVEPRVVYHGTTRDEETSRWNEELKSFDTEHSPFTVFRRKVDGERNSGFFFNSEKDNAYGYGYNTYDTFLDLKNPLVIDCKGSSYDAITFKGETRDTYEWARYAEQSGYDGVVFSNVADGTDYGAMSKTSTDYVAFSPNQIKSATDNVGTFDTENDDIRFSIVTDKKEIERLNSEPTIKVYRAMQLRDGKLYPPMAGKVNGKWQQGIAVEDLGKVWEKADEYPELADEKGRFTLNKGNGTSLKARYNPYIHTSTTPLNDQFSSAQSRPELVTVEVEIPESELTSGYKAEKAKDNVGKVEWKAGAVQGQLTGTRVVILSRWDKPVRIVPESEVADRIMEMFDGKDITMPSNVVTPALREELEKRGVPFVETDNQGRPVEQSEDIEKVNAKFNEQLGTLTEKNADRISLSLGSPSDLLLSAGVEDKPMKLYGNKVMQKMRKHGFALEELRNLPEAVSNPIAVFNNYGKDGNRSILTELRTRQGNILVSVSIGEDADVDFNIVRSVFGKRDANVVDWINKGLATYINKEKALSFLSHQSAPIAATAANAELSTATKVVESFVNPSEDIEKVNAKFNEELQKQIEGNLPDGHIYQLGKPGETLLSTGVPNLPIQMSATKLEEKSSKVGHNYDLNEVRDLVNALQHPLAVFAYGNKEKSQNIIVPLQKDGKNFIVGLSLSPIVGGRRLEINSVRNVFPKDNAEWLNWITQGKALYIDKTKIQTLIDQQRTILADVEYLDLDSVTKVVESFVNPSEDIEKVNAKFNGELQKQIEGTLPNGHIYKIGLPGAILQSAGFPNTPIELGATRLAEKAAQRNHEFEIGDVKDLVKSINDPIAVFAYGDKNKAQNVIVGLERDGKHFVVGIHFNQKRRGSEVSDIRGLFNKDNAEWLNWISQGKSLYLNKAKIQTLIDKQRTNLAEVEYLDLDSVTKIVDRFENANIGRTIFSRQKAEEAAVSLGTEMVDLDRYRSANDAVREMLETSVEKKGLPAVLGRDGMCGYVLDIFRAMPEEQRRLVAASAVNGFGGDIVAAMQKDLADRAVARDLTTNIDKEKALDYRHLSALRAVTSESPRLSSATEVVDNSDNPNIPEGNISRDIWDIAGNALEDALGTRGVEVSLNRNDVMWIAAQAAFSQERSDILAEALRQAVALRLGRHASQRGYAEEGLRFSREGGVEDAETREVAGAYSRAVNSVWNRLHESFVDQYNAINRLVETMEKSSGKAAKAFEDIRLALNQQGSRALAAMNEWVRKYNTPMWDAIKVLMKEKGCDLKAVERYVMIKHALERNEVFARRDARDYYRAQHDARVEAIGRSDDSQAEKDAAIAREDTRLRRRYADIDAGTDIKYLEFREHDYGGLTGLFSDYGPDFAPQRKGESDEDYNRRALAARRPMFEKDVETGTHLGDGSPVTRKVADIARIEAEARREVAAFESGHADAVDELWQRINAATKATLRHQYESNVISRAQYEEVSGMFEHYVPLRGFADRTAEDLYDYYNSDQGGSFAPPLLRARGRRTESESPFGYIGAMASSGIAQDMKNQAKLALYYFVSNRKGNGVISVSQMWFEKSGEKDAQGRAVFVPAYPPFSESLDAETGKKAYEDWEKMMQEKAKSGLAFRGKGRLGLDGVVHIDKGHEAEHVIPFKLGGRDLAMYVNGSPRAAQAVNGTLNYDSQSNVIIDTLNQILRTMAALNTQLNPEFWISNFQRDALFALMAVSVKEDPGYNRAFRRNLAKARGVIGLRRRYNNGTLGTGRVEDYYREFVEGGGVTGYTVVYDNDYWEKKLREYSGEDRNVIGRILGSLDGITDLGEGIEQMTRFAAYMTSRERGKDIREAVADAKELTVNFNRKGSGRSISLKEAERLTDAHGRPLSKGAQFLVSALSNMAPYGRSMIMFFNAAVQGLNAMVRLWKKNPGRTAAWAGGYLLLGAMNAILHALFGDDDDDYLDIPDWERRNNLMLGLGGAYLKWALPQEARAFYAAGDIAVNHALGHSPHKSLLGETFAAMVDVMPVELTEGAAGLAPSAVRPIVDIWVNRDFTGARVYNENRFLSEDARKGLPEYRSALPNTPKTYVALSQALNWLSGGDSYSAGAVNINPNKVEHLVSGYSGGVGTTANKTLHLLLDVAGGDFSVRNTPFLRRVVTIPDERYGNAHTAELFYYYKGIADDTRRQMKEAMKAGDADKYGRLAGSSEAEVMNIYETFRKQLEWYGDELKATDDKEERRMLTRERDALRDEMTRQITELK